MKKNFLKLFLVILSLGISQLICYYVLDDIFVNFSAKEQSFLCLRLFIAMVIYFSLNWVIHSPISIIEKDILFLSYLLLTVSISLLRFKVNHSMNFNIAKIIDYSKTTITLNILFYIPFGYYLRSRLNIKTIYNFIIFLLFVISIEFLQYFLKVGFFDVNDIILNFVGFLIGYFIRKPIINFLSPKIKSIN